MKITPLWAPVAALALALGSCSGSSEPDAANTPTSTTPTSVSSTSATTSSSPSVPAEDDSSSAEDSAATQVSGEFLCGVIRTLQADLGPSAVPGQYEQRYILAIAELLVGAAEATAYAENADREAKDECPTEYAAFLRQADLANLADL